jgi:sulfatase maturation enzyme AslB (radical SAM superfamily)
LRINIELLLLLLSNLSIMVTFTTNICVLNRQWFEWHKVKFANI